MPMITPSEGRWQPVPVPRCTQGTPRRTRTTKSGLREGRCGFNSVSPIKGSQALYVYSVGSLANSMRQPCGFSGALLFAPGLGSLANSEASPS